ncbi:trypsin CFT-1-like [Maniola jurtina]|uniref:trypsin CFT-1-like n=1 Tax=Maniola jurtina TaxID=191418 RepID=UPI001E686DC9|nr:trypsin CFT-1-like [Maniola jurtina]
MGFPAMGLTSFMKMAGNRWIKKVEDSLPQQQRIAGGVLATPGQHPYAAAIFFARDTTNFHLICGGAILNNRSVLSASSCWIDNFPNQFRIRVGSIDPKSGGTVHNVATILSHPTYNAWNRNNNIGIIRASSAFPLGNNVRPIMIAGTNYAVGDNQYVWTMGWGQTTENGPQYGKLHRVDIRTINQAHCQNVYGLNFLTVTMMCAGWTETPRGACSGDMGSPLVHRNVTVGVTSFITGCGDTHFPAIYTRVNRYTAWIQTNA